MARDAGVGAQIIRPQLTPRRQALDLTEDADTGQAVDLDAIGGVRILVLLRHRH